MADVQTSSASNAVVNSGTWRVLAWLGVALQAAALVFVLWSEEWGGASTIAVFLVVSTAFLLLQNGVPALPSFLIVLAAIVNAGGWAWNWYDQFTWFDEAVHAYTSFATMSAVAYLAYKRHWTRATPGNARFVLWTALVGLGLGVVWEIFESSFLNLHFWDTIVDLIMDTIGAALAGWFVGWVVREAQPAGTGRHA